MAPTTERRDGKRHAGRDAGNPVSNVAMRRDWVMRWLSGGTERRDNHEQHHNNDIRGSGSKRDGAAHSESSDEMEGKDVESNSDDDSQYSQPSLPSLPENTTEVLPGAPSTDQPAKTEIPADPATTPATEPAPLPTLPDVFSPPLSTIVTTPIPPTLISSKPVLSTPLPSIPTSMVTSAKTSPKSSTPITAAPVPGFTGEVPRKGVDNSPDESTFVTSPTSTIASITTVTQALAVETLPPKGQPYPYPELDRPHHKDGNDDGRHGGMSDGAEHALIAVGSIGAFVLLCLVGWFIWKKFMRKSDRKLRRAMPPASFDDSRPNMAFRAAAKVPWLRDRFGGQWVNMDDGSAPEKMTYAANVAQPARRMPSLTTRFGPSMPGKADMVSPLSESSLGSSGYFGSAPPAYPSASLQGRGQYGPDQSVSSFLDQYGGTMTSLAPPPQKQSELSRQPSDARDPLQARVNRLSELSSLSSGFGDGDIIVEPQGIVVRESDQGRSRNLNVNMAMVPPPQTPLRKSFLRMSRFSWVSRKHQSGGSRDTMYTATSQDSPPRFRSVNSWVNQQTGRVRWAQRRGLSPDEEEQHRQGGWDVGNVPPVPGIPAGFGAGGLPPEERAPRGQDGEVARPVEEVMRGGGR